MSQLSQYQRSGTKIYKLWKNILEAIGGTDQDFTNGSLGRAIFMLSVPMILEMLMESVFAIVDIFFVSKLGARAVATVGITESMMILEYEEKVVYIAIIIAESTMAVVAMILFRRGKWKLRKV